MNRLSPVGFTLSSISDYLDSTYIDSFRAATLERKMEDLSNVFFEALYWRTVLASSLEFAHDRYGNDPRTRVEVLNPYEAHVRNQSLILDDMIKTVLNFRGMRMLEILNKSVPEIYP